MEFDIPVGLNLKFMNLVTCSLKPTSLATCNSGSQDNCNVMPARL